MLQNSVGIFFPKKGKYFITTRDQRPWTYLSEVVWKSKTILLNISNRFSKIGIIYCYPSMRVIMEVDKSWIHGSAFIFSERKACFLQPSWSDARCLAEAKRLLCSSFCFQNLLEYLGMNLPSVSLENQSHTLQAGEMESWNCVTEYEFYQLKPSFLIWLQWSHIKNCNILKQ